MDKPGLIRAIVKKLESDFADLKMAARATYEAATHEESKAENEYDTRGLEASYLAGAQAKRVIEHEELVYFYKNIHLKKFKKDDPIAPTALVELKSEGKTSHILIMGKGGGISVNFEGKNVKTVTINSPLGAALVGLNAGDEVVIQVDGRDRDYEVISVE